MDPLIQLKKVIPAFLIILALLCFGLSRTVQAVSPAPDGGYPGGNTAEGQSALLSLATGGYNTAVGFFSLKSNTGGAFNTAIGAGTLFANTAQNNTATGAGALLSNTSGFRNTANGAFALFSNTQGSDNEAIGASALGSNTTGFGNVALGDNALINITTGANNIALGPEGGFGVTTATGVICIGSDGNNVDHSCFIGHIRGVITQNNDAIPVLIDSAGQLGTASSSRRYKTDIKPMDKASESILELKPVSFRYKAHKDTTPQFGLIAEDVAEVNPSLVIYNADGKPYTVRYDAVNAMLLNEFLKEHHQVQDLRATVAEQQKQIEALTAGLLKVNAQLELTKSAPQTVLNDQ